MREVRARNSSMTTKCCSSGDRERTQYIYLKVADVTTTKGELDEAFPPLPVPVLERDRAYGRARGGGGRTGGSASGLGICRRRE